MGELTQNGHEISGTTTNKPTNVESGQQYFDETLGTFQVYSGSAWVPTLSGTATHPVATITTLTSTSITSSVVTVNAISGGGTPMTITSKSAAAAGASGVLVVSSAAGGGTSGNSGAVTVDTGDTTDGVTGALTLTTGDAAGGTNDSGDIVIDTGTSAGGAPGTISVGDANAESVNIAASGKKVGFFGTTPIVQVSSVANSSGTDAARIDAIRDALVTFGLMASS